MSNVIDSRTMDKTELVDRFKNFVKQGKAGTVFLITSDLRKYLLEAMQENVIQASVKNDSELNIPVSCYELLSKFKSIPEDKKILLLKMETGFSFGVQE